MNEDGYCCMNNAGTQARLLANDPTLHKILFRAPPYTNPHAAAAMVHELSHSTHLQALSFDFSALERLLQELAEDNIPDDNIPDDYRWIAIKQIAAWIISTPSPLDTLHLRSSSNQRRLASRLFMPLIVNAVVLRNQSSPTKLLKLSLDYVDVSADNLAMLLQGVGSALQELSMEYCVIFSNDTHDNAARHVAQSLTSLSCLSTLSIDLTCWNLPYYLAMLDALKGNTTIQTLKLCNHITPSSPNNTATVEAMASLFRDSTAAPWTNLELYRFTWTDETLGPIVGGIQASCRHVKEIKLYNTILDTAAVKHLQSLYTRRPNGTTSNCHLLDTLLMEGNYFEFTRDDDDSSPDALERWISGQVAKDNGDAAVTNAAAATASCSLRHLQLPHLSFCRSKERHFAAVMRGLQAKTCTVQKLSVGCVRDTNLECLLEAMPYFYSVTHIAFEVGDYMAQYKDRIVQAFRRNRSIVESNLTCDFFTATDYVRLQAYQDRNRHLVATIRTETAAATRSTTTTRTSDTDDKHRLEHTSSSGQRLPSLLAVSDSTVVQALGYHLGAMTQMGDQIGPKKGGGAAASGPRCRSA